MHPRVRTAMAAAVTLALAAMVLPTSTVGVTNFGAFGSKVAASDNDFAVTYAPLAGVTIDATQPVVCRLVNSAGSGILTDYYYLHWGATCVSVSTGDIRLTTAAGGAAGTTVQSGNTDHGQGYAQEMGEFLANVRYLETDGLPGFSTGDFVYFSTDTVLDSVNGDIRLVTTTTNSLTSTAGTIVTSTAQAEVTEANDNDGNFPDSTALSALPGGAVLRFFDVNGNGNFDHNIDRLYLAAASDITAYPGINDIPLSSANSQTYGSRVLASSTEYVRQLTSLGANAQLVRTNEVTTPEADRHLYIHFPDTDGSDNHILQNDIILKGGSGSFGGRVTTVAEGQREEIGASASLAANLFFLDVDSNNHYTPDSDPVYINRPVALGGASDTLAITALDLRVTSVSIGGATYAAGSVVTASDQDVTSWAGLTANDGLTGAWFVMLHDVDQSSPVALTAATNGKTSGADATWTQGLDGAYIAASSAVAGGDTRLFVMPQLRNVVLECNGTVPDHPSCTPGALVASDPLLKSTTTGGTFAAATSAVYYDADDSGTVTANDVRYYHATLAPAIVAGGDADIGATLFVVATGDNHFRSTGAAGALGTVGILFYDVDRDATIETGDIIVYKAWGAAPAVGSIVSCIDGNYDEDCGAPVLADANIRVTGTDATYTAARSEYVYHSRDANVNAGDFRFFTVDALAPGVVAAGAADTTRVSVGATDELFLHWCEGTCAAHPNNLLHVGDLQLASGSVTRATAATAGHVPTLTAVTAAFANQAFKRYDLNAGNGLIDDVFYLSFHGTADRLGQSDIRLNTFSGKAAGTQVISSDAQELAATVVPHNADSAADGPDFFAQLVKYIDLDGTSGYSAGDAVYVDNFDADLVGGTDPGPRTGDVRLTSFTGSTSYAAGSTVFAGNPDALMGWGGSNPAWTLYFFDENRDGLVSLGEAVYLNPGAAPAGGSPSLHAVRLVGTTATTPPGGGNPTTPPGTSSPPPSTTPPATTGPTTTTTTTSPPMDALAAVTQANQALASSLEVRRIDGDNILSWQVQAGVAGYQIWHSASPYTHVADIEDPQVNRFVHEDGPSNGTYLVTAWAAGPTGTVGKFSGDLEDDSVPGNEGQDGKPVPADSGPGTGTGTQTDTGTRTSEPVPGLGFAVAALAVVAFVALVRRRL